MNKHHYTPLRKLGVCILALLLGAVIVVGWSLWNTVQGQRSADQSYAENVERAQKIEEMVVVTTAPVPSTTPTTVPPVMVTEQPTTAPSTTVAPTTTTLPPLPTPPTSLASEELFGGMTFGRIGLADAPIFEGNIVDNDAAALDLGLAHLAGLPLPGSGSNVVIGGHRTSHLRPFYYLDTAQIGDEVTVVTTWGVYVYVVYDVWDMVPARTSAEITELHNAHFAPQDRPGETLTLYACTPEGKTTHRIIVHADLVSVNGRSVA